MKVKSLRQWEIHFHRSSESAQCIAKSVIDGQRFQFELLSSRECEAVYNFASGCSLEDVEEVITDWIQHSPYLQRRVYPAMDSKAKARFVESLLQSVEQDYQP